MSFTPSSRQDTSASIVGGLLGGLVVAGSLIAFLSVRGHHDARPTDEVTELRLAVADLRAQTAELRTQLASKPAPPAPPAPVVVFQPPAPPAPPAPPEPPMTPPHAISCAAENACTIDRSYLIELLANPSSLNRQVRIIPSLKDGEVRGLKLYGIRPGSLPKLLGYKNGDLLLSINGVPLTNSEAALTSYTNLRRSDILSVELERKGERMTKTCDLR